MSNFHANAGRTTMISQQAPFPWLTVVCLAGIVLLLYNIAKWIYRWATHWWSIHVGDQNRRTSHDYDDEEEENYRSTKKSSRIYENDDEEERRSPRHRRGRRNDDYD